MGPEDLDWFFVPGSLVAGTTLELPDEEARHALKSLRLKPGDPLVLTNGQGAVAGARVLEVTRRSLVADIVEVEVHAVRPSRLWLAPAVVRGPRFDFVVEKATELGVAGLVPLLTRRSEVRPGAAGEKPDRWRRLMVAALKQSRQAWLPEIAEPTPLAGLPARFPGGRLWVAHPEAKGFWIAEQAAAHGDVSTISSDSSGSAEILLTGPEGGWHPDELATLQAVGARFVHLGGTRLRAETAALALLTWALSRSGSFRSRGTP